MTRNTIAVYIIHQYIEPVIMNNMLKIKVGTNAQVN